MVRPVLVTTVMNKHKKKRAQATEVPTSDSVVERSAVHHGTALGAVLGPSVGAAADAELEPEHEHEAKAEEP